MYFVGFFIWPKLRISIIGFFLMSSLNHARLTVETIVFSRSIAQ